MQAQGRTAEICHASEEGMVPVVNLDQPGHRPLAMLTSFCKFRGHGVPSQYRVAKELNSN